MIPAGSPLFTATEQEVEQETSRTYRLDLANGRISGIVDGLEAVKQAAFKLLQTERFEYLIYDSDYGAELQAMIGLPGIFVPTELERVIREALLSDERIEDVRNLEMRTNQDETLVRFDVITSEGTFSMDKEVSEYV
ncbi:DUF2634 domain-containing protein [Gorillibacterium sp. CAU 1737]|uniref:DUF2634 domain-containing protein n=1 Tax=Gorillibacterium sp. CAU 1737 TaxID=3140362 RepID=UPI0032607A8D